MPQWPASRAPRPSRTCSSRSRASRRLATATRSSPASPRRKASSRSAAIFTETADNEKEHAKVFFKYLEGGDLEITASYPAGKIGTTAENLAAAAAGEKMEWGTLYPDFAAVAEAEGFADVATSFREIAEVEAHHEDRYNRLLANVNGGTRLQEVRARPSGSAATAATCSRAPRHRMICPACKHPQAYYELLCEGY